MPEYEYKQILGFRGNTTSVQAARLEREGWELHEIKGHVIQYRRKIEQNQEEI